MSDNYGQIDLVNRQMPLAFFFMNVANFFFILAFFFFNWTNIKFCVSSDIALFHRIKIHSSWRFLMEIGNFFSFFNYWTIASPQYKKLVIGLLLLALFNSSDVFLLLKTKEITGDDRLTIGAYILYNVVFAIGAYPLGGIRTLLPWF